MKERVAADILGKLKLLEGRLGQLAHKPLRPFAVIPSDPLDLQRAARRLASHVGLEDLTFIVSIAKQATNVGGHVELQFAQREVFIELDGTLVDFPESALTALAHEVTHKLLHHHQIWIEPTLENERLTDIAAVYAGFGTIMLNGCESETVETRGNTRSLHRFTGGYLDRDELGLVFATLEYLSPGKNGREHLLGMAESAVLRGESTLSTVWPGKKDGVAAIIARLRASIRAEQALLATIAKDITYLKDHALPALEEQGREAHHRLCEALGELGEITDVDEAGPSRGKLLAAVRLELGIKQAEQAVARGSASHRARKQARKASNALEAIETLPPRTTEMFRLVACPIDGAKLRIPGGKKRVAVRCPRCSYSFIADSTLDDPELSAKKSGWFRR